MSQSLELALKQAKAAAERTGEPAVIYYEEDDAIRELCVLLKRQARGLDGIVIVETVSP